MGLGGIESASNGEGAQPAVNSSISSSSSSSIKEWKQGNLAFYDQAPLEGFAKAAGLDQGCDIKELFQFGWLYPGMNVLEVGGGTGRAVKYLLEGGIQESDLTVIEANETYAYNLAVNNLGTIIFNNDITEFVSHEKYGAITYMWSGFCDHPPELQPMVFEKLFDSLRIDGRLIIDLPTQDSNATDMMGQTHIIESDSLPTYHGHVPTHNEMLKFYPEANMRVTFSDYCTDNGKQRRRYMYEKLDEVNEIDSWLQTRAQLLPPHSSYLPAPLIHPILSLPSVPCPPLYPVTSCPGFHR